MEIGLKLKSWFFSADLWMGGKLDGCELGKFPTWKESALGQFAVGQVAVGTVHRKK